nr:GntR family transcriptional regulator [Ureaplasma parvum]
MILKIAMDQYKINELIPSEYKLASYFNCGRITIHNAYEVLKVLGIVTTIKGSGYYVYSSIDHFTNKAFANLYKTIDNIKYKQLLIDFEYHGNKFNSITKFSLIKNKKIIAVSYYITPNNMDLEQFDTNNINISKQLILSGFDDFFNVKTQINYENINLLKSILEDENIKFDTPIILNKLTSSSLKVELLVLTHISKEYFDYEEINKLIIN